MVALLSNLALHLLSMLHAIKNNIVLSHLLRQAPFKRRPILYLRLAPPLGHCALFQRHQGMCSLIERHANTSQQCLNNQMKNLSSEPLLKYFIIRNFTPFVAACNLGVWAQSSFSDQ